jgi:tRNA dimethylallyltransferase
MVFIIAGPTASGKTALAIELAKRVDGEIVSADSMQIYKGLKITTAVPTDTELAAVPHHLIGVIDPAVAFSVADYVPLASAALADIVKRDKQPILTGGTGLYIKALRDGIDFDGASSDKAIRERLLREAEASTDKTAMWRRLLAVDPESAALIPPQNITRVIRALEITETAGIPFSDYKRAAVKGNDSFNFKGIYLDFADREVLYARINRRVDAMIEAGMVKECEDAYRQGTLMGSTISQAIGYKELIPYFEGQEKLSAAIDKIKQSTRRYAKRQLTWFRHDNALFRVEIGENDNNGSDLEKNLKIIYEFFSKQ